MSSLFTQPVPLPLTPTLVYHAFLLRVTTHLPLTPPQVWWVLDFAVRLSTTRCPGDDLACYPAPPARRPWLSNVTSEGWWNVLTWPAWSSEEREEGYDAEEGCSCVCPSPRDIHRELNSLASLPLPYWQLMSVKWSHHRQNSLGVRSELSNVSEHFSAILFLRALFIPWWPLRQRTHAHLLACWTVLRTMARCRR